MFLGGSRFQFASSPRGFVESDRGFGIWLAQWHLHINLVGGAGDSEYLDLGMKMKNRAPWGYAGAIGLTKY